MGLFSRWFGRRQGPGRPLADEVFAAAHDLGQLEAICRRHREEIAAQFPGWRQVPEPLRDKPALLNDYLQRLVVIARVFAERLGDARLIQELTGTPANNPILRWSAELAAARQLKDELRYREAADRLADVLIDVRGLKGSAVEEYLPVTLGEMGECLFQAGRAERALAPTEQALALVHKANDRAGARAYLGNLYEMHRYLDQAEAAAGRAEELAELLAGQGEAGEAGRYRRQARLVRGGEPRNRVVVEIGGQRYEMEEVLQGVEGGVKFYFERNKLALRPSAALTERGGREGSAGRYDEALALFREAAAADRFNPQPRHDAAVTLMHLGRVAEALDEYAATEELAPGWFHCRHDRWLAEQIALGRVEGPMFLLLHAVEDGGLPPLRALEVVDQGLQQAPDLGTLHHQRGKALAALGREREAVAAFRRAMACAEEPDLRSRVLVDLAARLEAGDERRGLLEEAIGLEGNLVAAATARIMLAFAA